MKKIALLGMLGVLGLAGVSSLTACNGGGSTTSADPTTTSSPAPTTTSADPTTTSADPTTTSSPAPKLKVGLLALHGESSSYDKNFIDAFKTACEAAGFVENEDYFIKVNVPETNECYVAAREWAEDGFDYIFADSFDHEKYILQAAQEYPDVQFCHATGTLAHTELLDNFHNAFAAIYEGRYLAGIAAGQRMKEDIAAGKYTESQAKIGYVGAFPYAEVISGYTSFYLGARSVLPSVTMDVVYTNSWYEYDLEKSSAQTLIQNGCKLISQHADSYGAPEACSDANVPNITYNLATTTYPDTYLTGSKINWAPYFSLCFEKMASGEDIPTDYVGTIASDGVQVLEYGSGVSQTAKDLINAAKTKFLNGTLEVFDTNKFTVTKAKNPYANITLDANGKVLSYLADVDTDPSYEGDTEVVENGVIKESKHRSAPYFSLIIDGVTELA